MATTNNVSFVYKPKSGERVFACRPTLRIGVVEYTNGSRHIVGDFVLLEYRVAQPGAWWKNNAIETARGLITGRGGVAWYDSGTLYMAVPSRAAFGINLAMRRAEKHFSPAMFTVYYEIKKDMNVVSLLGRGLVETTEYVEARSASYDNWAVDRSENIVYQPTVDNTNYSEYYFLNIPSHGDLVIHSVSWAEAERDYFAQKELQKAIEDFSPTVEERKNEEPSPEPEQEKKVVKPNRRAALLAKETKYGLPTA